MDTPESVLAVTSAELAVMASKGLATIVSNRYKAIRDKPGKEDICNSYEEIINELVQERARAISIAQMYEDELRRYQISDEDIQHLQNTVSNALDIMSEFSPEVDVETLGKFKNLISADTLKAMQVLGFDYKAAIGAPLTKACANAIESKLVVGRKTRSLQGQAAHKRMRQ